MKMTLLVDEIQGKSFIGEEVRSLQFFHLGGGNDRVSTIFQKLLVNIHEGHEVPV